VGPDAVKAGPVGGALSPVPPVNQKRLRASAFEDLNFILLNILETRPALAMQLAPALEEEGRTLDGVIVHVPSGDWLSLYFDRKTHLLARIRSAGDQGDDVVADLEDYREVNGYKFSFRQRSPGVASSEAVVKELKVNPGLPASLFQ
jgi:hypothetical protein